jgi:hypothetical protein
MELKNRSVQLKRSGMKWHHAKKDKLPTDRQEVVISVGGIYRIAHFDADRKIFNLKHHPATEFKVKDHDIYWHEIAGKDMTSFF